MILNKDEADFVKSALIGLSNRQPKVKRLTDSVWIKVETLNALTELDRAVLALAIQGKCMHDGPGVWLTALPIVESLGVKRLLEGYLKSWAVHSEGVENE